MKVKKDILDELTSISWKDVNQMIKKGEFDSAKNQLGKETFRFIAKDSSLPTVVELAYTSLQKTDSKHAIIEQAVIVAEEMQKFAKTIVEKINEEEKAKGE